MHGENYLPICFQAARKRSRPPDNFEDLGRVVPPLCDHRAQIPSSSLRVPALFTFSQPYQAASFQDEFKNNDSPQHENSIVDNVSTAEAIGLGGSTGFWRISGRQASVNPVAVFANESDCFCEGGDDAENFGTIFDDDEAAALIDDFSSEMLFSAPLFHHGASACFDSNVGHKENKMKQQERTLAVPTLPAAVSALKVPSLRAKPRLLTKVETARQYRKEVAIPRYLAKRARRNWTPGLMHPSRSVAAKRRPRNGGQFGVVSANFVPASALRSEAKISV